MNEIIWPEGYVPAFTDNFASNEVIVAGLTAADVWPFRPNSMINSHQDWLDGLVAAARQKART